MSVRCQLCLVCSLAVTKGHSRWMVHLCDYCKADVRKLNEQLGINIPIGIHSIVNGYRQSVAELEADPETARRYWEAVDRNLNSIGSLHAYAQSTRMRRCRELGLVGNPTIDVEDFVQRCLDAGINQEVAWADFQQHVSTIVSSARDVGTSEGGLP